MSNNLPSFQACIDARHKLEAAVRYATGIRWLHGIADDRTVEPLREEFIEQMQGAVRVLGLEMIERHPQPTGPLETTGGPR